MISRSPESVAQIRMLRKFGVSLITLSHRDFVAVGLNLLFHGKHPTSLHPTFVVITNFYPAISAVVSAGVNPPVW